MAPNIPHSKQNFVKISCALTTVVFSLKEVKRNRHNKRLMCENVMALNIFFLQDLL